MGRIYNRGMHVPEAQRMAEGKTMELLA